MSSVQTLQSELVTVQSAIKSELDRALDALFAAKEEVRKAREARAAGLVTHVGPIVTSDVFYDAHPDGVTRWGRRGYLSVEMEAAALFLIAMREQGRGREVRAGTILTVSDILREAGEGAARATAAQEQARDRERRELDAGMARQRGLEFGIPYYWNIAPERDATFTPSP